MKLRALHLLAAFTAVILFSNIVSFNTKNNKYSESYPAVVCAPNQNGQTSAISLASSKTLVRKTGTSTLIFKESRTRRFSGTSQATVIDSQAITPLSWQVRTGVWAGGLTCISPITSEWFVGGSADLTSKGTLTLVNSGLGKALVGVTVYNENGEQAQQLFAVRANSFKSMQLGSLAPGSKALAIHVTPETGRINAFVTDERGRGLQALGGDTVNSASEAAKVIVIPAIPHQSGNRGSAPHILRILIPGEVGSQINVEIKSTDGTFSPAGIDGRLIPAGKVIEIPLDVVMPNGKFALLISAERPLIASVFTKLISSGKSDFLWSTSAPVLQPSSYAVTGLAPLLVFTGEKFAIDIDLTPMQGKKRSIRVTGDQIATYQVSDRISSFTVTKISDGVYGAALISSKSGFGYAPLVAGSVLTRTSIPRSNIRVLIP